MSLHPRRGKLDAFNHGPYAGPMLKTLLLASCTLTSALPGAIVIDLFQDGPDTVMNMAGQLDLTGLTHTGGGPFAAVIVPNEFELRTVNTPVDFYAGLNGPATIGSGGVFFATFSAGDPFGIYTPFNEFEVPAGYISNTPISSGTIFGGVFLGKMGIPAGSYVWTTPGGLDSVTLNVAAIPEPSTYLALAGFAGLGALLTVRRLRAREAKLKVLVV